MILINRMQGSGITIKGLFSGTTSGGEPFHIQPACVGDRTAGVYGTRFYNVTAAAALIVWRGRMPKGTIAFAKRCGSDNSACDSFHHFISPQLQLC